MEKEKEAATHISRRTTQNDFSYQSVIGTRGKGSASPYSAARKGKDMVPQKE